MSYDELWKDKGIDFVVQSMYRACAEWVWKHVCLQTAKLPAGTLTLSLMNTSCLSLSVSIRETDPHQQTV